MDVWTYCVSRGMAGLFRRRGWLVGREYIHPTEGLVWPAVMLRGPVQP